VRLVPIWQNPIIRTVITVADSSARTLRAGVHDRARFLRAELHEAVVVAMQHAFDRNRISAMGWLRRHRPVFRSSRPPLVVVTRRDDVLAVLNDPITFPTPYGAHLPGPFLLGVEGEDHARQRAALHAALTPADLTQVMGTHVAQAARDQLAAVRRPGEIDVGAELVRPLLDQIIADFLGVPGPDSATQWQWARDIFENIFLNFGDTASVRERAAVASAQMSAHVRGLIARRRAEPDATHADVLQRLLAAGELSDDEVCYSLIGLAIGWLWHGARTALTAVDELLDRPEQLASCRQAAQAGDQQGLARLLWEILRFRPVQAFVARRAAADTVIAAGTARETRVRSGDLLLVGTHSAMWDDERINRPERFDATRADEQYLIFGRYTHRCLGEQITRIQLPALLGPLLSVDGLRRANGRAGRLRWDGPRPDGLRVVLPA
jgi:cytochrome P450